MITIDDVTIGYGRRILMENISITAGSHTLTALLGRNGSGKSTLIRTMCGLAKPLFGNIAVGGRDISGLPGEETAKRISFVGTDKVRIPGLKCRDVVSMGRAPWTGWTGRLTAKDEEAVQKAMEWTGMSSYSEKTMDRMSDGECQKIMIARALAQETPVMLLDEPTAFLDIPGRFQIISILKKAAEAEGKTVIFSTHDLEIAMKKADRLWIVDPPRMLDLKTSDPEAAAVVSRIFRIPQVQA